MISTLDIAWAAGFFEGEGCFQVQHSTPAIAVSQKQKEPLERLLRLFGGNLCFTGRNKVSAGKVRDGYWKWQITGYKAAGLMMTVFGMLSPRRKEQAAHALKVWRDTKPAAHVKRTVCFKGHKLDGNNVYTHPATGKRRCNTCRNDWQRDYFARRKTMGVSGVTPPAAACATSS